MRSLPTEERKKRALQRANDYYQEHKLVIGEKVRQKRRVLREKGVCTECGKNPPEKGFIYCSSCKLKGKTRRKEEVRKNPTKEAERRRKFILRSYGITEEEYGCIWEQQRGLCPICDVPLDNNVVIDHDHKSRKVRGILHRSCNMLVGLIENRLSNFFNVLTYLGVK